MPPKFTENRLPISSSAMNPPFPTHPCDTSSLHNLQRCQSPKCIVYFRLTRCIRLSEGLDSSRGDPVSDRTSILSGGMIYRPCRNAPANCGETMRICIDMSLIQLTHLAADLRHKRCLISADVDVGIIPIRGCVDIVAAEIKKGGC
jgi:hypothetical protein